MDYHVYRMNDGIGPTSLRRRHVVTGTGAALLVALAGCLDDPAADPDDEDATDENGEDDEEDVPDDALFTVALESVEVSDDELVDLTIDLEDGVITDDDPATLTVALENTTDDDLTVRADTVWPFGLVRAHPTDEPEGEPVSGHELLLWSDSYEESDHVELAEGRFIRTEGVETEEQLDPDETVSRTFELGAEPPHLKAGPYAGGFQFGVAPADDWDAGSGVQAGFVLDVAEGRGYEDEPVVVEEDPRVDEPPHEIEEPDIPDDEDADWEEREEAWNEGYLGENIETDPSLDFEALGPVSLRSPVLRESDVDEFRVDVIEDESERDQTFALELLDEDDREAFEAVDFNEQVLVLVETGWGSGSVVHQWARIEDIDDGLHLHGYYTSPFEQTDDLTTRRSALLVDRPDGEIDLARVSLTTSEDRRVHFNSTEGIVTVE